MEFFWWVVLFQKVVNQHLIFFLNKTRLSCQMFGKCSLRKKHTPPKFNSSPLKSYHLKRKGLPSDHPFFRGELLNFWGVYIIYICLQLLGMCISESRLDLFVCFLFYLLHLPSSNPGFWPPKTQARNVLIKVFDHHEENGPCWDVP